MKKFLILIAVLALIYLGYKSFSDNQVDTVVVTEETTMMKDEDSMMLEDSTPEDSMENESMSDEEAMMEENTVTFDVEGGVYYFEPNVLEVKKGDRVVVNFSNVEGMHDFVIDEFDVNSGITETGENVTVEFVADQAGEFEFYCSVNNHREQGMFGTLIVEE